nr:hypothetical protein GCM10025732_46580 [Glycomyces mayteni]
MDLVLDLHVEQLERFERAGVLEGADVDRAQVAVEAELDDGLLGVRVVGRDEDVEADGLGEARGEGRVERLDDPRAGRGRGDLLCGGLPRA